MGRAANRSQAGQYAEATKRKGPGFPRPFPAPCRPPNYSFGIGPNIPQMKPHTNTKRLAIHMVR